VGAALYSPFNLPLVLLPLPQGFALYWWFPFAACALGIYAWLRLMRTSRWIAVVASVLTTTAPSAVWWSGWLCQVIAHAVIPCALLIAATRVWPAARRIGVALAIAAGLAAAGLPWFYQPWAVPAALFAGAVT